VNCVWFGAFILLIIPVSPLGNGLNVYAVHIG